MSTDLEKLQGTWQIVTLEVQGSKMPDATLKGSKIVVKGDTFSTISMGAVYKGTMKLDETCTPKQFDLLFTEGPEKGNTSYAIYELDGDNWKLCMTLGGKNRPKKFATKAGSGHALETLQRVADDLSEDAFVPREVPQPKPAKKPKAKSQDASDPEIAKLQGDWVMVSGEHAGQSWPEAFIKTGRRVAKGNETTVTIAGQVMLKATFTLDTSKTPHTIDYTMSGAGQGPMMYGIYEWDGDTVRYCFSTPGQDRPTEFATKPGDEWTLTVWKISKK